MVDDAAEAPFRSAFADYNVDRVSAFGERDTARLLADPGIVRNRLKVAAVIDNARKTQELRRSHGSFHAWLDARHPQPIEDWTRLFRRTFRFTGGLIVNEFLMSLGYLRGAHERDCPVYARILPQAPPWSREPGRPRDDRRGSVRCCISNKPEGDVMLKLGVAASIVIAASLITMPVGANAAPAAPEGAPAASNILPVQGYWEHCRWLRERVREVEGRLYYASPWERPRIERRLFEARERFRAECRHGY